MDFEQLINHRSLDMQETESDANHVSVLQNKLHRNAGPEDLVATEAMLKRITSEGSYNENFVAEFRIFRDELREFFNAATFTSMLEGVRPSLEDADIEVSYFSTLLRYSTANCDEMGRDCAL